MLDERGQVNKALPEVLALLAENDVILGTGHVSFMEMARVIPLARQAGVKRIVVTHPESPIIDLSVEQQRSLKEYNVWFERCYVSTMPIGGSVPLKRILSDIRELGVETTILATDLGQVGNPPPVQGFQLYLAALAEAGFSPEELDRMARQNPAAALGL